MSEINEKLIRKLISILDDSNLSKIDYETNEIKIRLGREISFNSSQSHSLPSKKNEPKNVKDSDNNNNLKGTVKAPMVGVAYLAPEPGSTPFVRIGDKVKKGQTILLIEAMKTFNNVSANEAGIISEILVSDGQPVEFDQPLIIIK